MVDWVINADDGPTPRAPLPTSTYDPETGRRVPYVAPVTPLPPEADKLYSRVRRAEGTAQGDGFVRYGGAAIKPGDEHPGSEVRVPGPHGPTSAAGPGQWEEDTWNGLKPAFKERFGRNPIFSNDADQKAMVWLNAGKVYPGGEEKLRADIGSGKLNIGALAGQWEGFKGSAGGGFAVTEGGKWKVDPSAISAAQARGDGSVWWMTPEEYRAAIEETPSSTKRRSLLKSLMGGDAIADLPEIETANKDGKVTIVGHDGSNRAKIASEELGPDGLIPVFVKGVAADKAPSWITDAHGNERPFNFAPVAKAPPPAPGIPDRIGTGLADVALGALQMTAGGAVPPEATVNMTPQQAAQVSPEAVQGAMDKAIADRERRIESERALRGETGTDWWRVAGNVAATAPLLAFGPVGVGGRAGLALGAAGGALGGALTPVTSGDFAARKAQEIGLGAGAGAVLGGAGNAIGQAIAPVLRAPVNAMLREGVRLTPGQMAGGAIRRIEDALASVPVLGQGVRSGLRRSIEDFNRAAWNRVLAPLGESLPSNVAPGRDAAQYVDQAISDAYGKIVPNLVGQADRQFVSDLIPIMRRATAELPAEQRGRFRDILKAQLLDKVSAPARGDQLKGIDSMLGAEARGYKGDPLHDNRKLGHILDDLHAAFRATLMRQNPRYAAPLQAVNEAYANFVRVARAAASSGAREGVFSPAQLRMAVRGSDPSLRKLDFARGEAMMQDLSDAAEATLPRVVPDSGTPERLMAERVMALLAGGGAAYLNPGMLAGGIAGVLPYTGMGMRALRAWGTAAPALRNAFAAIPRTVSNAMAPAAGYLSAATVSPGPNQ